MIRTLTSIFISVFILLMFNFFGITDTNLFRLLFIVISLISLLFFTNKYFKLLQRYHFLKFSAVLTIFVLLQIIRSTVRGNEVQVVLANAQNFFFYPSTFFTVILMIYGGNKSTIKAFIIPVLFLCGSFYFSKYITPLHRVGGSREGSNHDYERIYFHGYQFAILVFFFLVAIVKFVKLRKKIFIVCGLLVMVFFILFLSYFRAFFLGPLILVILFFSGYSIIRKILSGTLILTFILLFISLFPALADRYLVVFDEGIEDDPTSIGRLIIFLVRYEYLSNKNLLMFGDGFMLPKDDYSAYTIEQRINNPLIFDNDNGYAGLIVALGFLGIVMFIVGHLVSSLQYYSFYKTSNNPIFKSIYFSITIFSIYILLISFVNDFFIFPYAVMPVVLGHSFAIATREEEMKQQNKYATF